MIIKKLTNFIGGKIMKTKIINTGSNTTHGGQSGS